MNPCELTLSITAFANAFAQNLNDDELGLASAAIVQLGDTLSTILAQRALAQGCFERRQNGGGSTGNPENGAQSCNNRDNNA